ncbi:MAG: phosphoenolpyruvate--protein phosphotransferase [Alistipes sp.]|nr:phosphoenolpyruvate--protein phosphotransferase [Alistipes sp.]
MKRLTATVRASEGIAIGRAFVVERGEVVAEPPQGSVEQEQQRFEEALRSSVEQIDALTAVNDVFAAHLEMVQDDMLRESVEAYIGDGASATEAVRRACDDIVAMFEGLDDEYLRERADDVKDVCSRLVANLVGDVRNPFEGLRDGDIIVDNLLTPSDMALVALDKVAGFVTREGGATAHVCIIARNHSIAAVVGLHEVLDCVKQGDLLVVDGGEGVVIVEPDEQTLAEYRMRRDRYAEVRERESASSHERIYDGERFIPVMANAGNVDEVRRAISLGADGIGLFRSEFLYMESAEEPSEEQQYEAYAAAAAACGELPLTIRTLDVGGDKAISWLPFPKEDNPFLGWRAIRVSLELRDMFRRQLRAILRASTAGRVRVMFPMITSVEELREAKLLLDECRVELDMQGIPFAEKVEVGVMIETPAAVFIAPALAAECDFFSIGTNDLTQYVMAADRGNAKVASLCDPYAAAVVEAVRQTIVAAEQSDTECCMCGEFASDSAATQLLIDCGLREFSVNISSVGKIKHRLQEILSK